MFLGSRRVRRPWFGCLSLTGALWNWLEKHFFQALPFTHSFWGVLHGGSRGSAGTQVLSVAVEMSEMIIWNSGMEPCPCFAWKRRLCTPVCTHGISGELHSLFPLHESEGWIQCESNGPFILPKVTEPPEEAFGPALWEGRTFCMRKPSKVSLLYSLAVCWRCIVAVVTLLLSHNTLFW